MVMVVVVMIGGRLERWGKMTAISGVVIRASVGVVMVVVVVCLDAQRDAGRGVVVVDRVRGKHGHGRQERLADLETDVDDDRHRLLAFALHQTPRLAAHHAVQDLEELLALPELSHAQKPSCHAATDLVILLEVGREIDEESTAHVWFQLLHPAALRRFETIHQEGAVF